MSTELARPLNYLAVVALALGLLGLWLWYLAPVPLVLGFLAVRNINADDGRQAGMGLAWAATLLGLAGSVLLVIGLVSVGLVGLQPAHALARDEHRLMNIGFAFNIYKDQQQLKQFPPAVSPVCPLPPDERLSWLALQLPYLERTKDGRSKYGDLAGKLALDQGYTASINASAREPMRAYQSFVAPADVGDNTNFIGVAGVGADAASLPKDAPDAGFFGYARRIGDGDLKAGSAYTLAVVATTRGGPWGRGGPGTARGVPDDTDDLFGPERAFGGLFPNGTHLLYADAHVAFVSPKFPAALLRAQSRINRAE